MPMPLCQPPFSAEQLAQTLAQIKVVGFDTCCEMMAADQKKEAEFRWRLGFQGVAQPLTQLEWPEGTLPEVAVILFAPKAE